MQIAGSTCVVCARKVVFAEEGKGCSQCGIVVHKACENHSTCSRCGAAYEIQQRGITDPIGDAVVPRRLRPSGPGAAVVIMVVAGLLIILMIFLLMMLVHH